MGSPTEFWTLNGLESPSDVAVCSLSHTLETGDVPQRYYLSAKACSGILRRAERRVKELPAQLRQALQAAAAASSDPANQEAKTMLSSGGRRGVEATKPTANTVSTTPVRSTVIKGGKAAS
jgi:hypothetical protein